jgi:hypothetical protein
LKIRKFRKRERLRNVKIMKIKPRFAMHSLITVEKLISSDERSLKNGYE